MDTVHTDHPAARVADRGLDVLQAFLGRRPSDDAPLPPGPWDPVIRDLAVGLRGPRPEPWAVEVFSHVEIFGPQPEPWRQAIFRLIARLHPELWELVGGWGRRGEEVALNPQPLPPRWAFMASLAAAAVRRAELIGDLGRMTGADGMAGRYVMELGDEICGNGRLPWPWPWPRPDWLVEEVGPVDLAIMAGVFSAAAGRVLDAALSQGLQDASVKMAEAATAGGR